MNADRMLALPAAEQSRAIREGRISAVELAQASLARIAEVNPSLNAFVEVTPDLALRQAQAVDRARASGAALGPLAGAPVALKDYTPTAGVRTTFGSRLHADHVPLEDAVIARRLRAAGTVLVGKTATPEFASSWFTRSGLHGVTRNPWDPTRSPGGSSGGAGVAVATGCVAIAEGCDMAGSIRAPASFCGCVGLKPSHGRIPFDALPTTFDEISHFGPLARTVEDAALFLLATSGPDLADMTSFLPPLELELPLAPFPQDRPPRVALSVDLGFHLVDPRVEAVVRRTAEVLEEAGAVVEEIQLPWRAEMAEAFFDQNLVWLAALYEREWREGSDRLDPLTRQLIEMGREVSGVAAKRTDFARAEAWRALAQVFARHDAVLSPTMAQLPPSLERGDLDYGHRDEAGRLVTLDMTAMFNLLAPCPAISVPAAMVEGLPVGVQFATRPRDEATALRLGRVVEAALRQPEWRRRESGL